MPAPAPATVAEAVISAWQNLQAIVADDTTNGFEHAFTFQFHLAWEIARCFGFSEALNVRFEVPCGRDVDGNTIRLDLLVWTDPDDKVAIELKAPLKSRTGMNSAMTNFRMRFYRDLHRLRHLVETQSDGIRTGAFLAVVNEVGYITAGRKVVNAVYRTYNGVIIDAGHVIDPTAGPNGYAFTMRMPSHPLHWEWSSEHEQTDRRDQRGRFWLKPMVIRAG